MSGAICLEQITNQNEIELNKFNKKQNPPVILFCQNPPGGILFCTKNESTVQQLRVDYICGTQ